MREIEDQGLWRRGGGRRIAFGRGYDQPWLVYHNKTVSESSRSKRSSKGRHTDDYPVVTPTRVRSSLRLCKLTVVATFLIRRGFSGKTSALSQRINVDVIEKA